MAVGTRVGISVGVFVVNVVTCWVGDLVGSGSLLKRAMAGAHPLDNEMNAIHTKMTHFIFPQESRNIPQFKKAVLMQSVLDWQKVHVFHGLLQQPFVSHAIHVNDVSVDKHRIPAVFPQYPATNLAKCNAGRDRC